MSELRNKMKVEMELRAYSPKTIKNYILHVSNFAKFYNKSPELLGENEIRKYLHYCIKLKIQMYYLHTPINFEIRGMHFYLEVCTF